MKLKVMGSVRLVGDAEVKFSNTGTCICKFGASDYEYSPKQKKCVGDIWNFVLWGEKGEKLAPYLKKFVKVFLVGKIKKNVVKDKTYIEVTVETLDFIESPKKEKRSEEEGNVEVREDEGIKIDDPAVNEEVDF